MTASLAGFGDIGMACLGHRTRMAARALTRLFNARMRPLNLQLTQFGLLVTVARGEHGTVAAMADALDVEASALLRNIDLLEQRGLLRSEGGRGRRGRRLRLTSEGEALLGRALPIWAEVQSDLAAVLGPDAEHMRQALRRLEAAAQSVDKEPA